MTAGARALRLSACAVLGLTTAVAAVLVHGGGWGWWLLALGAPFAVAIILPAGWPRIAHAVPFALLVWVASLQRPEGDFLIRASLPGYGFLVGALALMGFAVVTMPRMRR